MSEVKIHKKRESYLYSGFKPEGSPDFYEVEYVLKSDYDALKKENEELSTSESEYQKVCEFIAKNFGDLSCCYDAEDVIGLAQSAVDRLKSKLEKAEAVISFSETSRIASEK